MSNSPISGISEEVIKQIVNNFRQQISELLDKYLLDAPHGTQAYFCTTICINLLGNIVMQITDERYLDAHIAYIKKQVNKWFKVARELDKNARKKH